MENKPMDLVNHAAVYFKECKDRRDRRRRQAVEEKLAAYGVHLTAHICSDKIDDEELWLEISRGRRKGIAAQAIDPTLPSKEIIYEEKSEKQVAFLKKACEEVSLLKHCDSEQIDTLIKAMFQKNVIKGEKIVTQGEAGDNFYLIGEGEFAFHIEFGDYCIKKKMSGKGSFGELALLYECPRTASVEAISDGVLWCLDQVDFKSILVNQSAARQNKFERALQNSKPLSMLTHEERIKLIDALNEEKYTDGTYIIQEFEKADHMYFLTAGEVKLTDELSGKEIATLQTGDYFGELALEINDIQKLNAIAVGNVTCALLAGDDLERLLGPYRHLLRRSRPEQINDGL